MPEVLVIGGGIAGLSIAAVLEQNQIDFILADSGYGIHASVVAAGLMNPISGRRYTLQEDAESYYAAARKCYQWYSEKTETDLYRHIEIYRLHTSLAARQSFDESAINPNKTGYISHKHPDASIWHQPFGGFGIEGGLQVHTEQLYTLAVERLKKQGRFYQGIIPANCFSKPSHSYPTPAGTFKQIIWTHGIEAAGSFLWSFIPFRYNTGELLLLQLEQSVPQYAVISQYLFAPLAANLMWCGAENRWESIPGKKQPVNTAAPGKITQMAGTALRNQVASTLKIPYKVQQHIAAVRPSIRDRKPVLGRHPLYKNMYILNGLGSKGYTLAPRLADCLINHIFADAELPEPLDVQRYYNLFNI